MTATLRSRPRGPFAKRTVKLKTQRRSSTFANCLDDGVAGLVQRFVRPDAPKVVAPANAPPIVILPGFGNNAKDYTQPFGSEESSIVAALTRRGFTCSVLPIERSDWFKVAWAIFSIDFWRGTLTTHPGYSWYLAKLEAAVEDTLAAHDAKQVILLGHSAGGWLGRAYLGDPYWWQTPRPVRMKADVDGLQAFMVPNPSVRMLITLGTPQSPPPADLFRDMTGGALSWVNRTFPGAFFKDQGVATVCVAGATVTGRKRVSKEEPRTPPLYAHDSYTNVCGKGQGVIGDAIVPVDSALLEGARNVVIPGVWHSVSKLGTWDEDSGQVWYGSESVVDLWLAAVVEELQPQVAAAGQRDGLS